MMNEDNLMLRILVIAVYKIAFIHGYITGMLIKTVNKIRDFFCGEDGGKDETRR